MLENYFPVQIQDLIVI